MEDIGIREKAGARDLQAWGSSREVSGLGAAGAGLTGVALRPTLQTAGAKASAMGTEHSWEGGSDGHLEGR